MDRHKEAIASAVRRALYGEFKGKLTSWRHEIITISPLETQLKVWPDESKPPCYFTITVKDKI